MYIDLTMPISNGMSYHPSHFSPQFLPVRRVADAGSASTRLLLSSHSGTHVDAESHFTANGRTVDEIPLELLIGKAQVMHITSPSRPREKVIDVQDLEPLTAARVLLHTGWAEDFERDDYYTAHPYLTEPAADYLISSGAILIGIDTPSVDYAPSQVHKIVLKSGAVLVENLINLHLLPRSCEVIAMPLRLEAVDASPARVVAKVGATHGA